MEYRDKESTQMHRRKSSKGEDDIQVLSPEPLSASAPESPANGNGHLPHLSGHPQRVRVHSTPLKPSANHHIPPSQPSPPGYNRTSFSFPRSPNGVANGSNGVPLSPLRSSFAHGRSPSFSSTFHHPPSSPLSSSFSPQANTSPTRASPMVASVSAPEQASPEKPSRRHARIHSRNLSVFFPRPGASPPSTIAEDGSQEIEFRPEAPVTTIPSAGPAVARTPLGAGFTFGTKPPAEASSSLPPLSPLPNRTTSRRGHHHKHSLSHNFFSFLEPGSQASVSSAATSSVTTPVTPFAPNISAQPVTANGDYVLNASSKPSSPRNAQIAAVVEFVIGSWLWVAGQQCGSLSSTALGYWVVFDAIGIALSRLLPYWLESPDMNDRHRRSYGNARVETVAYFSSSIYLLFAAVYVCKESVEHVLLSAGGHAHHHHGDHDSAMIKFPVYLLIAAAFCLFGSSAYFDNHQKFVNITGFRIPPLTVMVRELTARHTPTAPAPQPTGALAIVLSTPYSMFPLLLSVSIIVTGYLSEAKLQRMMDLGLAFEMAFLTGLLAYQACVTLGTVLLQTSPGRGRSGGKMESFLRAMREIERHPQVLHLPAPHIWQLTPSESAKGSGGTTVVTMELHVKDDLSDDDVLSLTKWAYEKCNIALRGSGQIEDDTEVTVGIVRG